VYLPTRQISLMITSWSWIGPGKKVRPLRSGVLFHACLNPLKTIRSFGSLNPSVRTSRRYLTKVVWKMVEKPM